MTPANASPPRRPPHPALVALVWAVAAPVVLAVVAGGLAVEVVGDWWSKLTGGR